MQLEKTERRMETLSANPGFVDPKYVQQEINKARIEINEAIRRYNNLEID